MMRRRVLAAIVIVGSLSVLALAAEEKPKPFKYEEGRAAARQYKDAIKEAEANFARTVETAKKRYAESLGAALKAAMQRGDLEEANRIEAARKSVEEELAGRRVVRPTPAGPPAAPALSEALVGVWRYPNGTTVHCGPGGAYTVSWRKGRPRQWTYLGGRKFRLGGDVIELSEDLRSFRNPKSKARNQIIVKIADAAR